MGYFSYHQAIPEDSDLYLLLAADRAENSLLVAFWKAGGTPLDLRAGGNEAVEEILNWYTDGDEEELASTRVMFDLLEATIEQTCLDHPGLKERSASVEKRHDPIQRWVAERCRVIGWEDGPAFGEQLLFGNGVLGSFGRLDMTLVRRAASFFREPGVLTLSLADDADFGDDLRALADLIIAADECNEIILMYGD